MAKAKYKMTADDREFVRILEGARGRIADGRNTFICHAIYSAGPSSELTNWISDLLRNSATLEGWQSHKRIFKTYEKNIAVRLQWIDAMIRFIRTDSWEE